MIDETNETDLQTSPQYNRVPLDDLKTRLDPKIGNFYWESVEDWKHDCHLLGGIVPVVGQHSNCFLLISTAIIGGTDTSTFRLFNPSESYLQVFWQYYYAGQSNDVIKRGMELKPGPLPQGFIRNTKKMAGTDTDWKSTDILGLYEKCVAPKNAPSMLSYFGENNG